MNNIFNKYLISSLLIASIILLAGCKNEPDKTLKNRENQPGNLEYVEDFFDFGTIIQGEVVSHSFKFRNAGEGNLVIKDIIPDCGCTKTIADKMVLQPNEEGKLDVVFDSKGWRGMQYKSVTLRTNSTIREKSITFKANVVVRD